MSFDKYNTLLFIITPYPVEFADNFSCKEYAHRMPKGLEFPQEKLFDGKR